MAAKTAALSVNIIADASKAKAAFKQAEDAAGSLSKQMVSVGKAIGSAFVGQQIVNFAKGSIKAASDLGESINAVQVTFGKASEGILKFGETASQTVGLSKAQFNSFAVQFAGFTQQIAGANGDVAKVTSDLTTRIADFASVMNLDMVEAARVFQSAMAGQTEPIRKFGIDMSAATVEAYALSSGLAKSKDEITESIKVQARYGLLMESTSKTQGDFANTSESLANSQRRLKAEFENMKSQIGEALLPTMESLLNVINPMVQGFSSIPPELRQIISTIGISTGITQSFSNSLKNLGITSTAVHGSLNLLNVAFIAYNLNQQKVAQEQNNFNNALSEFGKASDDQIEKQFALAYSAMIFADGAKTGTEALRVFAQQSLVQTERLVDLGLAQKTFGITTEEAIQVINEEAEAFQRLNKDAEINQQIIDGTIKVSAGLKDVASNVDKLESSWKVTRNTFSDGRFVSKALVDVWREGYSQLIAAGDASEDLTNAWREGYGQLVDAGTVSEDLVDAWREGYSALIKGKESSDFLINAWREGYKALREADSVSVDLKNSWLEGYRAMINGRKASDELTESVSKMGAQARNTSSFVDGLTGEWQTFLDLLDKKDAFESAQEAIKDYEETFSKAAKGNKEAQEQVNEKLRQGQREIAKAMEAANLIPVEQAKKILFLVETGKLQEALDLLKVVDGWYRTVQERAAVTPSGMGSGRQPAPAPVPAPSAPAPPSMTLPKLTPRQADLLDRFKGLASGGTLTSSGLVMVGENGPELLGLPRGASVTPNIPQRLNDMAGGGTTIVVNVQAGLVSSPDQVGQQIIEAIKRAERRSGQVFASV
jgi:hypothetical protein